MVETGGVKDFFVEHMPKSTQGVGGCLTQISKSTQGTFLTASRGVGCQTQILKSTRVLFWQKMATISKNPYQIVRIYLRYENNFRENFCRFSFTDFVYCCFFSLTEIFTKMLWFIRRITQITMFRARGGGVFLAKFEKSQGTFLMILLWKGWVGVLGCDFRKVPICPITKGRHPSN